MTHRPASNAQDRKKKTTTKKTWTGSTTLDWLSSFAQRALRRRLRRKRNALCAGRFGQSAVRKALCARCFRGVEHSALTQGFAQSILRKALCVKRFAKQATERLGNRAIERPSGQSGDRAIERSSERALERSYDPLRSNASYINHNCLLGATQTRLTPFHKEATVIASIIF